MSAYAPTRGPLVALNPQYQYSDPSAAPGHRWDPLTAHRLSRCHRRIPKYLFRAWAPASGGDSRLNTPSRITPHAFLSDPSLDDTVSGYPIEATMSQGEFVYQTSGHLGGHDDFESRFSSWTMSFGFAVLYALVLEQRGAGFHSGNGVPIGGAHISVIDTEMLRESNPAVYVPDIGFCIPDEKAHYDKFPWEYLVHGVVENPAAYKAVSVAELVSSGLFGLYPEFLSQLDRHQWWSKAGRLDDRKAVVPLTARHIRDCAGVVAAFGETFAPAIALALASTRLRDKTYYLHADPDTDVLDEMIKLYGGNIPDWKCRQVMTIDVLEAEYTETWQFVKLMRNLHLRNKVFGPGIIAAKKMAEMQMLAAAQAVAEKIRLRYLPAQMELWRQSMPDFAVTPDLAPGYELECERMEVCMAY